MKDEAILKIKEQLKKLMSFAAEEEVVEETEKEYETIATEEGKELMKEKETELAAGTQLMEKTETGMVKCGKGKYKTLQGMEIEVDEEGKVVSIEKVEEELGGEVKEEEGGEKKMEEVSETPVADIAKEHSEMVERVSALENQISEILEILQGLSNSTEMALSKVKEFGALPAAEPVKNEVAFKSSGKSSIKGELDELREIRKKYKITSDAYNSFSASPSKK